MSAQRQSRARPDRDEGGRHSEMVRVPSLADLSDSSFFGTGWGHRQRMERISERGPSAELENVTTDTKEKLENQDQALPLLRDSYKLSHDYACMVQRSQTCIHELQTANGALEGKLSSLTSKLEKLKLEMAEKHKENKTLKAELEKSKALFEWFPEVVETMYSKKETEVDALVQACANKRFLTAEVLITCGWDVLGMDGSNYTSLHWAALFGSLETVQLLFSAGAKALVHRRCKDTGQTPLHLAAMHDHLDVARELIKHGARRSTRDKNEKTPLDLVSCWKVGSGDHVDKKSGEWEELLRMK